MKKQFIFLAFSTLFAFVMLFCSGCRNHGVERNDAGARSEVRAFVAASLTDVITEIADSFMQTHNVQVTINLASSGTLARQIEQGAPADVYISANKKWAVYLDSLGILTEHSLTKIARNALVLIASAENTAIEIYLDEPGALVSVLGEEMLAIGDPAHVPAGMYAKQALKFYDAYLPLQNKMLPTKDVRSSLRLVEMGEARFGIVYLTDAMKSSKIETIVRFPDSSHSPIGYYAGVIGNDWAAKEFHRYLLSSEMAEVWMKYGFNP